jgi:hypothetical protein
MVLRIQYSLFPKDVSACEGSMATKVHFDRRREPAQVKPVPPPLKKSGFGQVHFPSHVLHPVIVTRLR